MWETMQSDLQAVVTPFEFLTTNGPEYVNLAWSNLDVSTNSNYHS